jgi:alkylated DNA repair dioxygenase AlkB
MITRRPKKYRKKPEDQQNDDPQSNGKKGKKIKGRGRNRGKIPKGKKPKATILPKTIVQDVQDVSPPLRIEKGYFTPEESNEYFNLISNLDFDDAQLVYYNFNRKTRRKSERVVTMKLKFAWFADDQSWTYVFGKNHVGGLPARKFPDWLTNLKTQIENHVGQKYNAALINFYQDGETSLGFHSDDDKWLGKNFTVASLSFGAQRTFVVRAKNFAKNKFAKKGASFAEEYFWTMEDGDLIVMEEGMQSDWLHSVQKDHGVTGIRYNITFRNVIPELVHLMPNGVSPT